MKKIFKKKIRKFRIVLGQSGLIKLLKGHKQIIFNTAENNKEYEVELSLNLKRDNLVWSCDEITK